MTHNMPLVGEHRIHTLLPLTFGDKEKTKVKVLENWKKGVLALQIEDLLERLAFSEPYTLSHSSAEASLAWRSLDGKGLALNDFYPYVQQILGVDTYRPLLCLPFVLQGALLAQKKGGKKRLFSLPLKPAAQQRSGHHTLDVQLDGARLFLFRTGVAILDIFWHYETPAGALDMSALLEGNYYLSHDNHSHSKTESGSIAKEVSSTLTPQSLRTIAEALLPNVAGQKPIVHAGRRILYSLVSLTEPVEQNTLRTLATWLSHRQTTDYQPTAEIAAEGLWQPFPYLCHGYAPEGGATVMFKTEQASDFVNNFVSHSGHNTYIPLFISSLHTHFWLLSQTEWIPAQRYHENSRAEKESIEQVYMQTVEFRRYFSFPTVSQLSLHNGFYRHWQEALSIPERLHFIEQTARDVADLIKARRSRLIGRLSGALGGFLVTHEVLEGLSVSGLPDSIFNLRVWVIDAPYWSPALRAHLVQLVQHWELGIFFGSVLGGLLGLWVTWNFDSILKEE